MKWQRQHRGEVGLEKPDDEVGAPLIGACNRL